MEYIEIFSDVLFPVWIFIVVSCVVCSTSLKKKYATMFFNFRFLVPFTCSGMLLCYSELGLNEVYDWMVMSSTIAFDAAVANEFPTDRTDVTLICEIAV